MHKSVYDITYRRYRLHKRLPREQEQLAQAILHAGKLRIDAEPESNFVRLLVPSEGLDLVFSHRELYDEKLITHSQKKILEQLLRRHDSAHAARQVQHYIDRARADIKRKQPLSPKIELMMARALVCCNAQPVIELLHLEGAEIFISFGQSVGEVMDIARWQEVGENSGLQAVGRGENAVYVSCGGHPFLHKDERRHTGDGQPALARFLIIAAQETGHNGDMLRASTGQWTGRHSAIGWAAAPSPKAGKGRLADIARTKALQQLAQQAGLARVVRFEESLRFYRQRKLYGARRSIAWLLAKMGWLWIALYLLWRGAPTLLRLQRSPYPATQLSVFFSDMLANLSPAADVYKRANPAEEEAVACIEAVARVPQQVIKWGHRAILGATPALYVLYYDEIVPACEKSIKNIKKIDLVR